MGAFALQGIFERNHLILWIGPATLFPKMFGSAATALPGIEIGFLRTGPN